MRLLPLALAAVSALPSPAQWPVDAPYRDPSLPAAERAADLRGRLRLEEKVGMMMNYSRPVERLGVPVFQWWSEALHGVGRDGTATVFPSPVGMAASFDEELVERVFGAVSDEARVKHNQARRMGTQGNLFRGLSFWTPNVNIFRDPRWGRGQETYGEDPYLTSVLGAACVRGLQGPDSAPHRKLLACAKHFAAHSGPERLRHKFNVEELSPRDLHETYLPAFKALVRDAGVEEVMCAYNRFEGEPCCGSGRLLQQILRREWGFRGLVTSDCGAIDDFWMEHGHRYSPSKADAAASAVLAGTDVECGGSYSALTEAVRSGKLTEAALDTSLQRLLEARFRLGDFDDPALVEWTRLPDTLVCCRSHKALALRAARESMVLLRNRRGTLPLDPKAEGLVVMGPNAADSVMMWGNYNGFPQHTVTILEGIQRFAPAARHIAWGGGAEEQLRAAREARTVVFVGGINANLEGEDLPVDEPGFVGGDRTTIELPPLQREVLRGLRDQGKRVVLVCCSGSAFGLVPETRSADAILQAWYGGEAGGQAVAETLFGENNPSGKLPVTFYRCTEQLPPFEDYAMEGRTYRYFRGEPLYAFGYGLSYSAFRLGKPTYENGEVRVRVSNTGKVDGVETVQVYVRRHGDPRGPLRSLRGFRRVAVGAGRSAEVAIPLPRERFEWWDEGSGALRVLPGAYDIYVGTSSRDADLRRLTTVL